MRPVTLPPSCRPARVRSQAADLRRALRQADTCLYLLSEPQSTPHAILSSTGTTPASSSGLRATSSRQQGAAARARRRSSKLGRRQRRPSTRACAVRAGASTAAVFGYVPRARLWLWPSIACQQPASADLGRRGWVEAQWLWALLTLQLAHGPLSMTSTEGCQEEGPPAAPDSGTRGESAYRPASGHRRTWLGQDVAVASANLCCRTLPMQHAGVLCNPFRSLYTALQVASKPVLTHCRPSFLLRPRRRSTVIAEFPTSITSHCIPSVLQTSFALHASPKRLYDYAASARAS